MLPQNIHSSFFVAKRISMLVQVVVVVVVKQKVD